MNAKKNTTAILWDEKDLAAAKIGTIVETGREGHFGTLRWAKVNEGKWVCLDKKTSLTDDVMDAWYAQARVIGRMTDEDEISDLDYGIEVGTVQTSLYEVPVRPGFEPVGGGFNLDFDGDGDY